MATTGKEPIGSMGTDTPLAVLSDRAPNLSAYFHQLFAQVTNPPIDPIREALVMSLETTMGPDGNTFDETPEQCHQLRAARARSIDNADLAKIRAVHEGVFEPITLSMVYPVADGDDGLAAAIARLRRAAELAIDDGNNLLILSDRGVDAAHVAIPALLALSAVQQHLVREGTRMQAGLVVETADVARGPRFRAADRLRRRGGQPVPRARSGPRAGRAGPGPRTAGGRDRAIPPRDRGGPAQGHVEDGHLDGAELPRRADLRSGRARPARWSSATSPARRRGSAASGSPSWAARRSTATSAGSGPRRWPIATELPVGGQYQWRRRGEPHKWNPATIGTLQAAVREHDAARFAEYERLCDDEDAALVTLRGLLELSPDPSRAPVPLDEVEPASELVKRFVTGAMSFGSISAEAHETLAIAMNRIGARSNSGEGGEEPHRYEPDENGDLRRSAIKQVASGRFGVTAHYLVNADDLQIKIAQGAKPGEGGQLPGAQGRRADRPRAVLDPGRDADLAAAAPRHLLDRGPRAADLRSVRGQPGRADQRQAGQRGRHRRDRRRGRQGAAPARS